MKLETKVGAFFIASVCIFGWLILKTEKTQIFNKTPKRAYYAVFAQAAGLPKQSKVRMAGVEVGRVLDIRLDNGLALVTFTVDDVIKVYSDATASLANIGILGEKYIDLNPGNPTQTEAPAGARLTSIVGVGMDAIMESIGKITRDIEGITYSLNASMGGEHGKTAMDEVIENLRSLVAELRATAEENHASFNRSMANIEAITKDFREHLPILAKQLGDIGTNLNAMIDENRPEISGFVADARKLAQGFQASSNDLKGIMDKLNNGEGTLGKLLTDDATIEKLNTGIDSLTEMLAGFKGMDMALDMSAASWSGRGGSGRVGLGLILAPTKDYWYSLEFASTPDGKISDETQMITMIDPLTGLKTEYPFSYRTVKAEQTFAVSAEFNKRLGKYLVVHAGVIDGVGGGGAEFRALGDRFRVGALAYDFTKRDDKENPRVKAIASYEFWKGVYAQAGVQDIANKELRSYFFGGGVRWKDDDLKKLVGLAGAAK
ncbi:MAG: MlaD family protein [Holophagales bacterium]|nr:MlaD family protein [Holophagales bacterium]